MSMKENPLYRLQPTSALKTKPLPPLKPHLSGGDLPTGLGYFVLGMLCAFGSAALYIACLIIEAGL